MNKSEFKQLIREEIKKSLNEAYTAQIGISEIRAIGSSKFLITVGDSSADLIDWSHKDNASTIKKIDNIMYSTLSAKRISKPRGEADQPLIKSEATSGTLYYQISGYPIYASQLLQAINEIKKMNITHTY
jgi:hypothetical protein